LSINNVVAAHVRVSKAIGNGVEFVSYVHVSVDGLMLGKRADVGFLMLESESLCLSTQSVISLRLKLKWELNALLPAHVNSGVLVFEYSIRVFFEAQTVEQWALSAVGQDMDSRPDQPLSCFLLVFLLTKKSVSTSQNDAISYHRPVPGLLSTAKSPASGVRSVGMNNCPLW